MPAPGSAAAVWENPAAGVGVTRPRPSPIKMAAPPMRATRNRRTAIPPTAQAQMGTGWAGRGRAWGSGVAGCRSICGVGGVGGPGDMSTPRPCAISAALPQRWERCNSRALRIACSVRGVMWGINMRGGRNWSGSDIRVVAVAGACPVSAW